MDLSIDFIPENENEGTAYVLESLVPGKSISQRDIEKDKFKKLSELKLAFIATHLVKEGVENYFKTKK